LRGYVLTWLFCILSLINSTTPADIIVIAKAITNKNQGFCFWFISVSVLILTGFSVFGKRVLTAGLFIAGCVAGAVVQFTQAKPWDFIFSTVFGPIPFTLSKSSTEENGRASMMPWAYLGPMPVSWSNCWMDAVFISIKSDISKEIIIKL